MVCSGLQDAFFAKPERDYKKPDPPNIVDNFLRLNNRTKKLSSQTTNHTFSIMQHTLNSLLNLIYWWSLCAHHSNTKLSYVKEMFIAGCALHRDTCENKTKQDDIISVLPFKKRFRTINEIHTKDKGN